VGSLREYLHRLRVAIRLIWRLGGSWVLFIAAPSLLGGILPVVAAWAFGQFVDAIVGVVRGQGTSWYPIGWIGLLACIGFANTIVTWWGYYWGAQADGKLQASVIAELMSKAYEIPLERFETPQHQNEVQFLTDSLRFRLRTVLEMCISIPTNVVALAGLIIYLARENIWLSVIIPIGTVPAVWARTIYFREYYWHERHLTPIERRKQYFEALLLDRNAQSEFKVYAAADFILSCLLKLYASLLQLHASLQKAHFGRQSVLNIPYLLTVTGTLAFLTHQCASGVISVGLYASYLEAVRRLLDTLSDVLMSWTQLNHDLRYFMDAEAYLSGAAKPKRLNTPATAGQSCSASVGKGSCGFWEERGSCFIRAENVSFMYPNTKAPALTGINVVLAKGEKVALVGPNGSGKTTLAKVLLGLYFPSQGVVYVWGKRLDEPSCWWRPRCAAVFQDFQRYAVSVRENIGFGCVERMSDTSAILSAAQKAHAHEFVINLPNQYDTLLGKEYDENGCELSEGQWQRVGIARAIFADADFVVLDEPAASLDPTSEFALYSLFLDNNSERTILLISHRLHAASLADRVIVLDRGKVAETGTHQSLLRTKGLYYHMYQAQTSWHRF